jgi:lipopolysaccharide export system permease protein
MNRINTYLFWQLLVSVLFSCMAITVVVWFSQSIRLLSLVINNGGSLWSFFKLMLLILPTFLPLILPLSLMVGALFVYHRLITESELLVMQAVGMGPFNLSMPAVAVGVVVAALGYVLTLGVAPTANHELVRLQYQIRNDHSVLLLRTGAFNDIRNGLTFYARERGREGEMRGLLIHDTRKAGHPVTIMAEAGELMRAPEGPKVLVKNGMRQEVDSATGALSQLTFDTYLIDLSNIDDSFNTRWSEPRERSINGLIEGAAEQPDMAARFMAELHMRLTLPFLAITFVLIACVFILTGSFDRRGITRKIISAATMVILLEAAMLFAINTASKNAWMVILLYMIAFVPLPFLFYRLGRPCPKRLAMTQGVT